ncbi:MAG: N-acetylneuraminate synthase family protein [Elusimicrobiota bacterium]|nr:N-acetylneuraminate synthase family protein [Elusimicrobiota bacterium]
MKIGPIDAAKKVFVIAEAGNNHEGDFGRAKALVCAAAEAGAHAVKFQTFRAERFVGGADPARLARLKSFELSPEQFAQLSVLAASQGILFISTPLDMPSVDVLAPIVDALKIASGDNDFYPLISSAASKKKPLIISTGLCDIAQVRRAVAAAKKAPSLALMHCVCSYPVENAQANLRGLTALQRAFPKLTVGYSDHTLGIEACVLSVALGARLIEKHFTLDKNQSDFRDHKLSADPAEMKALVRRVAEAEVLLGDGAKKVMPCEVPMLAPVRRSLAAASDLAAGHRMTVDDLLWLRPSGGLRPGQEKKVVGRRLVRAMRKGEPLLAKDLR